ncbi:MAG: hypothetical protein ACOYNY_30215, partial [Caldilineaceae bacterium]
MPLNSRLQKDKLAFVLHDPPLPNRVRDQPSTQNTVVLGWLPPGLAMTVIGGPVTANGLLWWKVQSDLARLTGWTPEHDGTSFFLGPVEEQPLCTQAVQARLHKGDAALVTAALPIHVRQTPSLEGLITDELANGAEVTIVAGPLCANQIVWWNITASTIPQPRWVAEGQEGQYFLLPVSINKNGAIAGHFHVVQNGETWGSLAQRFGTTSM